MDVAGSQGSDSDDDDVPAPAKPAVAPKKAAEPQAAPKSEPMEVLSPEEEEKLQVRKQVGFCLVGYQLRGG